MMIASAKADMKEGADLYNKRHEGSEGTLASTVNISKAIEHFSKAINIPESEKEAALYLLKSYYYKAEFAIQDEEEKKCGRGSRSQCQRSALDHLAAVGSADGDAQGE